MILNTMPISKKGVSIDFIPIQVRIKNTIKNVIIIVFFIGLNLEENLLLFWIGLISKIKILMNSATTPPILLGILRRIAYANKKYHSGWIWIGVFSGSAGMKFSGSLEIYGEIIMIMENNTSEKITPTISFTVKNGWNSILSLFIEILIGFEDPVVCNEIIWINAMAAIINGKRKWSE